MIVLSVWAWLAVLPGLSTKETEDFSAKVTFRRSKKIYDINGEFNVYILEVTQMVNMKTSLRGFTTSID